MTITLPLNPSEEARLLALARSRGLTPEAVVHEAIDRILMEQEAQADSRPIWEVIAENMRDVPAEEFAKLPVDGASEVDHYLYGHSKRNS